jgi:hypothetical protein
VFPLNRSDFLKVLDHGATWWRHWHDQELQQFNTEGPVIDVGPRSFQIRHQRSDDPEKMFREDGLLRAYLLVAERVWSRLKNNFLGRGAATGEQFRAAVETHIANQKGWHSVVKAQPVAERVKSVIEHSDIYRVYLVSLDHNVRDN